MKQCVSCLQWKDETAFNWRYKALGIRHGTCQACQQGCGDDHSQKHRDPGLERISGSAREYVYNYLLTHPCTTCGESDPKVLEFHYVGGKGWITSSIIGGGNSLVALQAEIAQCIVLCANCHRKILNGELVRFKGKKQICR